VLQVVLDMHVTQLVTVGQVTRQAVLSPDGAKPIEQVEQVVLDRHVTQLVTVGQVMVRQTVLSADG
jgi:hypothetical protein